MAVLGDYSMYITQLIDSKLVDTISLFANFVLL